MPQMMMSWFYLAPERLEQRRVPVPEPATGELLVRVRAALTCGTDVKTYRRGHPKFPPPFAFGHEFGGDVVASGAAVEGFPPGTRVTANVFAECGECFYCRRGQGNLCENLEYNFGAFSDYMIIPASIVRRNTFVIPAHVSYAEAAIVEPLVTVVHGQQLLGIQPGESVAIIGAGGPVSLLHMQLARSAGAGSVIAVGHSAARLAVAQSLGAEHVIDAATRDAVEAVRSLTDGRGADVVIECAGSKQAWETSMQAVRRGGRVLWFSGLPAGTVVAVDAARVHYGQIALLNSHGGTAEDARRAFELICTGGIDVRSLISDVMPLDELESALRRTIAGEVVKIALEP
ncbi:MAG: zinc-binding dehydrogenase [Anaerolineae bacterium]